MVENKEIELKKKKTQSKQRNINKETQVKQTINIESKEERLAYHEQIRKEMLEKFNNSKFIR